MTLIYLEVLEIKTKIRYFTMTCLKFCCDTVKIMTYKDHSHVVHQSVIPTEAGNYFLFPKLPSLLVFLVSHISI